MCLSWPESGYLVNDQLKFVYCPIPKVASSSLKQWFLTTIDHEPGTANWPERPHQFLSEWLSRRGGTIPRDYMHFAFVRDPRRRLVSAFLQKFVVRWDVPESPSRPVVKSICESILRPVDHAQGVCFRCFARYVADRDPMALDVHWRPQHLFFDGDRDLDFIGHVESFDIDMMTLNRKLGLPHRESFHALQLPYASSQMEGAADMTAGQLRRLKAFPDWRSFYDEDLLRLVSDYYAEDDRRFGYVGQGIAASKDEPALSC